MNRSLALLSMLAALGAASPAMAGGYVAVGVGSDAALAGDLAQHFTSEALDGGRVAFGTRLGTWALEVSLAGTELQGQSGVIRGGTTGDQRFASRSLGVDLKFHIGLLGPIEGYVRGGLHKTWIAPGDNTQTTLDLSGDGYTTGAGVQLPIRFIPGVQAAAWADYSRQVISLSGVGAAPIEGTADMFTVGISVGTEL